MPKAKATKQPETRSRKMHILTTPRLYAELEREAAAKDVSVNELVNRIFSRRYPKAREKERAAALLEEIFERFPDLRGKGNPDKGEEGKVE